MMNCKQYVFSLTSGQLDEAPTRVRMEARVHRWMCPYCRAFTRNDAALTQILTQYGQAGRLLSEDAASDHSPDFK
ncbi:MAG: hypothetical protein ACK4F8_01835 [Aquabacterium sp.]